MLALFHQNRVDVGQGGIERYIATLLSTAGPSALLVTGEVTNLGENCCSVRLRGPTAFPKWLRFALGILFASSRLRREFIERSVTVAEYSRAEYVLFAWMFKAKRIFTIHGTGPARSTLARLVHNASCYLLPYLAHQIIIAGPDYSAIPISVQRKLGLRLSHFNAWFDDVFRPSAMPDTDPFIVLYAGRVCEQKGPEILFEVIRRSSELPFTVAFRYCGSDYQAFVQAGLDHIVQDCGLLNAEEVARLTQACHVGILCSKYGEGSPFFVIETLACGRGMIVSALPTLLSTYSAVPGIVFASLNDPSSFLNGIAKAREIIMSGLAPDAIAASVSSQKRSNAADAHIRRMLAK